MYALLLIALVRLFVRLPLVTAQTAAAVAYAPVFTLCPVNVSLIRDAGAVPRQRLSSNESAYINKRRARVLPGAFKTYLSSVLKEPKGIRLPAYVHDILDGHFGAHALPRLGMALSGGSYNSALFSAGIMNAFDSRNISSVSAGTGGLLQALSYIVGESGGAWPIVSLLQANFPTIQEVIFGPQHPNSSTYSGWLAQFDIVSPTLNATLEQDFVVDLVEELIGKSLSGFPVTISDVFARSLSRHFVNGTNVTDFFDINLPHGAGITYSSLVEQCVHSCAVFLVRLCGSHVMMPRSTFKNYEFPFPILVAGSVSQGGRKSPVFPQIDVILPLTDIIYELNLCK